MRVIIFLFVMAVVMFALAPVRTSSQLAATQVAENDEVRGFLKMGPAQKESMRVFNEKFQQFASVAPACGADLSQKQTATKPLCENPK